VSVTANGQNPPQTKVVVDFTPGQATIAVAPMPMTPPAAGWVRVGNQYAKYDHFSGNPAVGNWTLHLYIGSGYGIFSANIKVNDTIEWVDFVEGVYAHGLGWEAPGLVTSGDPTMRAHPTDTPLVTLAVAQIETASDPSFWPQLEGFVQDGRYSYAGAQARANADLSGFVNTLETVEWETDDLNALPGRSQAIAMDSPALYPGVTMTTTILRVEITFPLRTLPPRRQCYGGDIKPSSFLDLVVTENN